MWGEQPEDARTLWQHQPAEPSGMTLERMRDKARELRIQTRKESLGNSALAVITIGVSAHGIRHTHENGWHIVLGLLVAWALIGWYLSHRGLWPARLSSTPWTPPDGLQFYRRELKRRRNRFGRFLLCSFGPAVLAMACWILIMSHLARRLHVVVDFVPLSTLALLWIIGIVILRLRRQRDMDRELKELAAIEAEDKHPT
jgi:hypothetical protein